MNQREFFKKAGLGSIALVSLLTLVTSLDTPAWAGTFPRGQGKRHATFVAQSKDTDLRIAMEGVVRFDPEQEQVRGGGSWVLIDDSVPAPKPTIDFGTWRAKELLSFTLCPASASDSTACRYGRIESSILELEVELVSDADGPAIPATLRLICNIGAVPITTGEPEGYVLTAPFGTFSPFVPALGLTHISVPERELGTSVP